MSDPQLETKSRQAAPGSDPPPESFTIPAVMVDSGLIAQLGPSAFAVLMVLYRHWRRTTGHAAPGVDRLAAQTGLNERTVRRILRELTLTGYTVRTRAGQSPTQYQMNVASRAKPHVASQTIQTGQLQQLPTVQHLEMSGPKAPFARSDAS